MLTKYTLTITLFNMTSVSLNSEPTTIPKAGLASSPLSRVPEEDLVLIVEFVLRSGSLKDLAKHYGVSYPTIRTRLDGVIERLRAAVEDRPRDPLAEALAELVQRGELTASGARRVLAAAEAKDKAQQGVS